MTTKLCEKYDARFIAETGEWLDKTCGDLLCPFCSRRPKTHKAHKWNTVDDTEILCGKLEECETPINAKGNAKSP